MTTAVSQFNVLGEYSGCAVALSVLTGSSTLGVATKVAGSSRPFVRLL